MASNSAKDYNYMFTSEPDDALKCLICSSVAKDPWQHGKCGRLLCKVCIDKYGESNPCPSCLMEQPLYFEDSKSKYNYFVFFNTYSLPLYLFSRYERYQSSPCEV